MAIIDNTQYDEILALIQEIPQNVSYTYLVDIVIDGDIYTPESLVEINQERNFVVHYSQNTTLRLRMNQQLYNSIVYPNRDRLELVVKRMQIGEVDDKTTANAVVSSQRYVATLQSIEDPNMQGYVSVDDDKVLNDYVFSIREKVVDMLRATQIGGAFSATPNLDIARALLTVESKKLKVDKSEAIIGVTVHPTDIQKHPKQIVMSHDVKLLDIVDYLQMFQGGIYNQGSGLHYHGPSRSWFIYPLYNTTRYQSSKFPVDIIMVRPNQMTGVERTYRIKDGRLFIAATSGMRQSDPQEIAFLNLGNGVRYLKATETFSHPVDVEANRATTRVNDITAQVKIKDRRDKVQVAPFSNDVVTDNIANQLSLMAGRSGQVLHIPWENADPDLILPGQPCRVLVPGPKGNIEMFGTVLGVQSHIRLNQPGMTGVRYKTDSALLIFASATESN